MKNALRPASLAETDVSQALAAAGVGIWRWMVDARQIVCNADFEEIHGLASADESLDAYCARIHVDDRQRVIDAMAEAVRSRALYRAEYRLAPEAPTKEDSQARWVEVTGTPLLANSAIVGLVGVCRDITERRRTELSLRRRTRQQETTARLATLALDEPTVQGLLDGLSAQIRDALGADFCRIMELDASGNC